MGACVLPTTAHFLRVKVGHSASGISWILNLSCKFTSLPCRLSLQEPLPNGQQHLILTTQQKAAQETGAEMCSSVPVACLRPPLPETSASFNVKAANGKLRFFRSTQQR